MGIQGIVPIGFLFLALALTKIVSMAYLPWIFPIGFLFGSVAFMLAWCFS